MLHINKKSIESNDQYESSLEESVASWNIAGDAFTNFNAKNTTDAMIMGAIQAITGAILLMANALQIKYKQPPTIIISGGNAKQIKDNLLGSVTNQALIVDNLVLQGLFLIDNFMQSEQ